jgi:hypothetical protein
MIRAGEARVTMPGAGRGARPNPVMSGLGGGGFNGAGPVVGPKVPVMGAFHEGGDVKKDGAYLLKKGEHVNPAEEEEKKRDSEYRRVYLGRKSKGKK